MIMLVFLNFYIDRLILYWRKVDLVFEFIFLSNMSKVGFESGRFDEIVEIEVHIWIKRKFSALFDYNVILKIYWNKLAKV